MSKNEITLKTLRAKGACQAALSEFGRRFGERVTVTEDIAASVAEVFDWDWAARKLLSPAGLTEYERVHDMARAAYERVCHQAWAKYERVCNQARAEYGRVRDQARAEYERVRHQAWAEYGRVYDQALTEYERTCARTFARLYAESRSDE